MYWGCFCGGQPGDIVEVNNKMNGRDYFELLQNNLGVDAMGVAELMFQQDNSPIHKSATCLLYTSPSPRD